MITGLFNNTFNILGHNPVLYNRLVSRLADVVRERTSASRKAEVGGVVINSCGWVRGEGYNQIKHIAQVSTNINLKVVENSTSLSTYRPK